MACFKFIAQILAIHILLLFQCCENAFKLATFLRKASGKRRPGRGRKEKKRGGDEGGEGGVHARPAQECARARQQRRREDGLRDVP